MTKSLMKGTKKIGDSNDKRESPYPLLCNAGTNRQDNYKILETIFLIEVMPGLQPERSFPGINSGLYNQ